MFVALNPADGLQLYVFPETFISPIAAPLEFDVQVFVNAVPALTVIGVLLTVTTTVEVAEHKLKLLVFVTVYVVVIEGLAIGLLTVEELKPAAGLQL